MPADRDEDSWILESGSILAPGSRQSGSFSRTNPMALDNVWALGGMF